jgi:hypothetical protein
MTATTLLAAPADAVDHDTYAMPDLPRLAPTTPAPPHADPAPLRRRSGQWDGQPGVAYAYSGRTGAEVTYRRRTRKEHTR